MGAFLYLVGDVLFEAVDPKCSPFVFATLEAGQCGDCIFPETLNHNFWMHFLRLVGTPLMLYGLVCSNGDDAASKPTNQAHDAHNVVVIDVNTGTSTGTRTGTDNDNVSPIGDRATENPAYVEESNPPDPAPPTPTPTPAPTPGSGGDAVVQPPADGEGDNSKLAGVVPPPADAGGGGGGGLKGHPEVNPNMFLIEDSVLKYMYDIFSSGDDGSPDSNVSDAELSEKEFKTKVKISELRKALKPIGGLQLNRLLPDGMEHPHKVDVDVLFWLLDRDHGGTITIKEFLKLCEVRYSQAPGEIILQDQALKRLYDLFSAADVTEDAGLTEEEFAASVDVDELKATLNKVKNLNVQWLFNLEGSKTVQAKKLFKALDKDLSQHVTIQEFTDLLNAKKDFLIGK
eukprot:gene23568-2019_t